MNDVYNVRDFGALGDGTTDDSAAIITACNLIIPSTATPGGSIIFPPGTYAVRTPGPPILIPSHVQVIFAEGAVLAPSGGCTVTINGPVTAHPMQHIFAGTGYNAINADGTVTPSQGADPLTVSGDPLGNFSFIVTITDGGLPGVAAYFKYSLNGGAFYATGVLVPESLTYLVPGTRVTLTFAKQSYSAGDSWSWTSHAAITLTSAASDVVHVKWWGAAGDGNTDDTVAIQTALNSAASLATGTSGSTVLIPVGTFRTTSTIMLPEFTEVRGMSGYASIILVDHAGVGLQLGQLGMQPGNLPGAPQGDRSSLVNVGIQAKTLGAPLAGYYNAGHSNTTIYRCTFNGFKYGAVLDAAEMCTIRETTFEGGTVAGLYIVNGNDFWSLAYPTSAAQRPGGATNVILVEVCNFYDSEYGVIDDGGSLHYFQHCNFEGLTTMPMCLSGIMGGALINTDFENAPEYSIDFNCQTSLLSTGVSSCQVFAMYGNGLKAVHVTSLGSLRLGRNTFADSPAFVNTTQAARIIDEGDNIVHLNIPPSTLLDSAPSHGNWLAQGGPSANRITASNSPPSSGNWAVGDMIWNSAVTAGGNIGWVCTTAGSPGTWNTFGAISN